MSWFLLILAGCVELAFTFCLGKFSHAAGVGKGLWGMATFFAVALSLYLVSRVIKVLPLGTTYAVWTGIGAVGTVLMGILFFKEPVSFARLFFISTLILSIIGLKVVSG